ncbi:MAG: rod shape-determining protein [Planctomycetes bacterium]|nr:rod shape-determining protein [Planctomycetota bacterium]
MDLNEKTSALDSPKSVTIIQTSTIHLGIDLGTNTSVLAAAVEGQPHPLPQDLITTVVGFPKPGILPGIIPSDAEHLFGEEAINYRLHMDLKWPLREGFIEDKETCRIFTRHLRHLVDPDFAYEIAGVVGSPANASEEKLKRVRSVMGSFLDRLLIVPEPFLAAMGLRDDEAFLRKGMQSDPTKHSLIVDIGAGTTDLCLVRGYFPTSEDLISINKAGDCVDDLINRNIQKRFPDVKLTQVTVRKIKEQHSFVSGYPRDASVKVYVDGRPRMLDFSDIIRDACDQLVPVVVEGIKELLAHCDSDSCANVMKNIIITGGGSQIHGLCDRVEKLLREDDYDCARTIVPADHKRLVARGALRIAQNVRDDQWQVPM